MIVSFLRVLERNFIMRDMAKIWYRQALYLMIGTSYHLFILLNNELMPAL